ncbi:NAD(+) synthase [Schaalia sp. lx-260]|uniref:NAD(+) synthase n=1 Tax=Schaalia sp. lx-260 TaxID=2899082 RepID=UPI001E60587D|nr:NAD(+) synthase [Schaalia sp. lx-260]MCD4549791.1 NAD(+) synthase [Schaalia sp. lx-260]
MNFFNIYDQGFARVAAISFPVHPACPHKNVEEIISAARQCHEHGVSVAVFPELSVSGYSLDDLFLQDVLLDNVEKALQTLRQATTDMAPLLVVGAPLRHFHRIYNCAVIFHRGRVLAVIPKTHLPNYREFYEKRYFATLGPHTPRHIDITPWACDLSDADNLAESDRLFVPFGPTLIEATDIPGFTLGVEICEDMWVPVSPASIAALHGATVLANLSASPTTVGRADDRDLYTRSASARLNAAYIYAAAGLGESSTDLTWDGHTAIYEAGDLLAQGPRFIQDTHIITADIDLDRLRTERSRQGTFQDNADFLAVNGHTPTDFSPARVQVSLTPPREDIGFERVVDRFPFVPNDPQRLDHDCYEAYNIQVTALAQRLRAIGQPKLVIGVSGGLDSTHALIVAAHAMDQLKRPRTDILAYTMPGFATSPETLAKAWELGRSLGVSFEEIDIRPAARQMLADMKHPYAHGTDLYDVTFENVQAGLRTDYLFRLANHHGGIVLGTGDLSELALGWCTYGVGDHMSHYGVNAGVPKTLIQHLIRWAASSNQFDARVNRALLSIVDQEISPELIPATSDGHMQSTQERIGPYNLQDFTLFYILRRGARPSKIAFLAHHAWSDISRGNWPATFPSSEKVAYDLSTIVRWERLFLSRYFSQQFKRSALPNGPKVVAGGSLSPRGDWRMPSDVSGADWVAELDAAVAGLIEN